MNRSQFISFMEQPDKLSGTESAMLAELLKTFPYFQTAHLLYAKSLHNQNSVHYNNQLKVTTTYAIDRKVLYKLITQQTFAPTKVETKSTIISAPSIEKNSTTSTILENNSSIENGNKIDAKKTTENKVPQEVKKEEIKSIIENKTPQNIDVSKEKIAKTILNNEAAVTKTEVKKEITEIKEGENPTPIKEVTATAIENTAIEANKIEVIEAKVEVLEDKVTSTKQEETPIIATEPVVEKNIIPEVIVPILAVITTANVINVTEVAEIVSEKEEGIRVTEYLIDSEIEKKNKVKTNLYATSFSSAESVFIPKTIVNKGINSTNIGSKGLIEKREETFVSKVEHVFISNEKVSVVEEMTPSSTENKTEISSEQKSVNVTEVNLSTAPNINLETTETAVVNDNSIDVLEKEYLLEAAIASTELDLELKSAITDDYFELENKTAVTTTFVLNTPKEKVEQISDKNKENYSSTQPHSFFDWLKHPTVAEAVTVSNKQEETKAPTSLKTEQPEQEKESKTAVDKDKFSSNDLIDKFLKDEPKIARPKAEFYNPVNMAKQSVADDITFMSETLAKIFVLQGNYNKALQAYENLHLKYPEKRLYFASQIKNIRKLISQQQKQ